MCQGPLWQIWKSWAGCAEKRTSHVHKFFFVAPQRKLWLSKAQLRSLLFILKDATLNSYFFEWIWYGEIYLDRL
jgi:hypothetical protein